MLSDVFRWMMMVPTSTIPYRTDRAAVNLGRLQAITKILQDFIRGFIFSDIYSQQRLYLTEIVSNRERGISHGFDGFKNIM